MVYGGNSPLVDREPVNHSMVFNTILILLIGFSVVSAMILCAVYSFLYRNLNKSRVSIVAAGTLLVLFAIIQVLHLNYLLAANNLIDSKFYSTLVLLTAPIYLLFVLEYIGGKFNFKPVMLLHFAPLAVNLAIPNRWSLPLGFLVGTGYAIYCVRELYTLRGKRSRYRFEFISLAFFTVVAIAIMLLGVFAQLLQPHYFIAGYSLLISCCFFMVVTTFLLYPDVAINLNEALETRYAKSTLDNIDQNAMLEKLDTLVGQDALSRNESLNLSMLAERSGYNGHQISELINSKLGYGVSQYIRQHRIRDARQMLINEPGASVLSVSLAVGFTSQSTFYAAFNQIVGMSPGKFRSSHVNSPE